MKTRVLIADDHGLLRAGLRALLSGEADIEVVAEAGDGAEVLRLAELLNPDIVLMDISMPGYSGVETTRMLKEKQPQVKVLILTVHEDKGMLQETVQAGASGFVLKRALKAELLNAIRAAMRGDLYIHPIMIRSLLQPSLVEPQTRHTELDELTPREVEVLRLIAQGYTNSQIAERLSVTLRTVEFHRSNLTGKLGISGRVELVRFALGHGLVDFKEDQ